MNTQQQKKLKMCTPSQLRQSIDQFVREQHYNYDNQFNRGDLHPNSKPYGYLERYLSQSDSHSCLNKAYHERLSARPLQFNLTQYLKDSLTVNHAGDLNIQRAHTPLILTSSFGKETKAQMAHIWQGRETEATLGKFGTGTTISIAPGFY